MNGPALDRSTRTLNAAALAYSRATGEGTGDIAIHILVRSCTRMMVERLGHLLKPHGITPMGYITMMALYSRPDGLANPSELGEATCETRGNMTRICDELVGKRWMRRVPNAKDRRRVDLSLTDSGVTLLDGLAPKIRQDADGFFGRSFCESEKATLAQLLGQLLGS
jgi:MarR family transcriptional repressor of emrRAB